MCGHFTRTLCVLKRPQLGGVKHDCSHASLTGQKPRMSTSNRVLTSFSAPEPAKKLFLSRMLRTVQSMTPHLSRGRLPTPHMFALPFPRRGPVTWMAPHQGRDDPWPSAPACTGSTDL